MFEINVYDYNDHNYDDNNEIIMEIFYFKLLLLLQNKPSYIQMICTGMPSYNENNF